MALRRPCVDCGTPVRATRCPTCQAARDQRRNATRLHYAGDYDRRAAEVRAAASVCWLCGQGPRPADPWQADHVNPGDPGSPLAAAHRSCNARRGNGRKFLKSTPQHPSPAQKPVTHPPGVSVEPWEGIA